MKFNFDEIEFESADPEGPLIAFAKCVMQQMQQAEADDGLKNCWTACVITMDGLCPDFRYGGIGDMDYYLERAKERPEGYLYVELPRQQAKEKITA